MIKIENVVTPSQEEMLFVIQGMRNPLNSWDKSDSTACIDADAFDICGNAAPAPADMKDGFYMGEKDLDLMKRLAAAGTEHRKYLRMMPVYARITAGHTWWSEFDTYKVGTVRNSCSKMHKIQQMEFKRDSFDHEGIDEVGPLATDTLDTVMITLNKLSCRYNLTKEKKYWRAIIELLPIGFHLTANVSMNYETLANIYRQRQNHKLDEWVEFCRWIETLPYSELITGKLKTVES